MRNKILAWCVHLYTATGLVAAAGMAILIIRGGDQDFRLAMLLMVASTLIDATDGMLARRAEVRRWTPEFDGRRLDDITDFHTYTSLPLLLIWRAELLSQSQAWWLIAPLLASAYGFSQVEAKTKDGFFLGFPSYWNVIAFYLYFLRPPSATVLGVILFFTLLTFVPALYLYPSYGGRFSRMTALIAVPWAAVLVLILVDAFDNPRPIVWITLAVPIYYLIISWWTTLMIRRDKMLNL